MKTQGTVEYEAQYNYLLSGRTYCYRSADAALRQSRRCTTNPGVTALVSGSEDVYLADGDCWIDDAGRQGQHHYGRGGRYINLVKVNPEPSVCLSGNPTVEGLPCGDPDCVCCA